MTTLNLTIADMACSACVEAITQAVQAVDTAALVQADTKTKAVVVQTSADPAVVMEAIAAAGYAASPAA